MRRPDVRPDVRLNARRGMALTSLNKRTYDLRGSRIYIHTESNSDAELYYVVKMLDILAYYHFAY